MTKNTHTFNNHKTLHVHILLLNSDFCLHGYRRPCKSATKPLPVSEPAQSLQIPSCRTVLCTANVLANSDGGAATVFALNQHKVDNLADRFRAALHCFAHGQMFRTLLRSRVVFARAMLLLSYSQFQLEK